MKSSLKVLTLSVFVVAASVSAAAGPRVLETQKALVGPEYVFPSSANVQGVGAYFKTRMVLTNPTGSEITVLATLSTPTGFSASVPITLTSFQTRVYENFLAAYKTSSYYPDACYGQACCLFYQEKYSAALVSSPR